MPSANIILVVEAPADGQKIVDGAIVGFYSNPDFSAFTYGSFSTLVSQIVEGRIVVVAKKSDVGIVHAPYFEYQGVLAVLNYDKDVEARGEFLLLVEFRPSITDTTKEFHIVMDDRTMYFLNCAIYYVLFAYEDSFKGKTLTYRQMLMA